MSKLFTVVGVSTLNGKTSIRVANDIKRSQVLVRNGHYNVHLVVLPKAMTKEDATAYWNNTASGKLMLDEIKTPQAVKAAATQLAVSPRDAGGRFTKQAFQFVAA